MTEGELKQLEVAYNKGVSLDVMRQALIDGGQEQGIQEVEDFFKKKKDFGVEDSVSTSVDSYSLSNLPVSIAAQQLPDNFEEQANANPSLAKRNGIVEDVLGGMVSDDPSEKKSAWFIADENPNEIQRLWNRGNARGQLADLLFEQKRTGYANLEDFAYYNSILQRDAPKESDFLKVNQDDHPIASFVLDLATMLPESLISSLSAPRVTLPAAIAGGAAGSAIPFFGTVGGALAGFFGTGSGAMEYAGSFFESLQEAGVDVTDEEQLREVLYRETPEAEAKLTEAYKKGRQKGIPVGILDGITAGRGGQFIKSAMKKGTSLGVASAKEIGFDAALGAGGEAIGTAAQGKDINIRDVLLEGAAGPFTGAPGAIYNYYATQALTPGERNYSKWAGTQDSDVINKTTTIALAVDNGRIGIIDSKIKDIKKNLKKPDQGRTIKKALQRDLKNLTNQKYTSLLEIQQQLVGLDSKIFDEAAKLTQSIFENVAVLRDNRNNKDFGPTEKAAVENRLDELGVELNKLINDNATTIQATGLSEGSTTADEESLQEKSAETISEEVTDQIYKDFIDTGNVSEGVLSSLADKIILGEALTDQERAIYSAKGSEVEKKLKQKQREQTKSTTTTIIKDRQPKGPKPTVGPSPQNMGRSNFKNQEYLNLFDPNDMSIIEEVMQSMSPGDRVEMRKMILASEAFKSINPNAKIFSVGITEQGYKNASRDAGFGDGSGTYGMTGIRKDDKGRKIVGDTIVQILGDKRKRKPNDKFAYQTAYHEVMHNVFADYFDNNDVDFNQFRDLIIRRLKDSDVKALNDFAERYEEKSVGAYKSEEFMVDLGSRLASGQIEFSPTFLEEIKAFLSNIVSKITNKKVLIFEDAALAADIAGYLTGITSAIKTGSDLKAVKTAESIRSDRFKRTDSGPVEEKDSDGDSVIVERKGRNLEGRPDPESYEKQKEILSPLFEWIADRTSAGIKSLEKRLGASIFTTNKKITQAQEVATSMVTQVYNRLFVTADRIKRVVNKFSEEKQKRILDLTNDYYFYEGPNVQSKALKQLIREDEALASDIVLLKTLLEEQQKNVLNNPAFDSLSPEMLETIQRSIGSYGVRSYRIFTDKNFKVDPDLRRTAEKDLMEQILLRKAEELLDSALTPELGESLAEYAEEVDLGANIEELTIEDAIEFMLEFLRNRRSDPQVRKIINEVRTETQNILKYYDDVATNRDKIRRGISGDPEMAGIRTKGKNLVRRKDLPESLRKMMGEEDNPFVRMVTTVTNVAEMNSNFTLIEKLNEVSRQSGMGSMVLRSYVFQGLVRDLKGNMPTGVSFSEVKLEQLAREMGLLSNDAPLSSLMEEQGLEIEINKENGKEDYRQVQNYIKNFFEDNYTLVQDKKSPMYGKAVSNEFLGMIKQSPMYSSDNKFGQAYYSTLLQMRKVRVLYNLPTWRKNIMGGWYFLAANGIIGYNKQRGGLTVMKDLRNRLKKIRTGEVDPELETLLDKVAGLGLLGASLNAALVGDINQSYYEMASGGDPNAAWDWLPKYLQEKQKQLGTKASRIAYQYGFIDDYTKLIAYLSKRENFAKRLPTNPDGKSYSELTQEQQAEVDLAVVERIKQNMPTMSRISPAFRQFFSLPMGDFLSFRVESFRSFYSIYHNSITDIREGITNNNLTSSQRNAYVQDGLTNLAMGMGIATMSSAGYQFIADQFLDDDEEKQLAKSAVSTTYTLPPWMAGASLVPASMNKDGTIRFINISSEDPYAEQLGLIFGREGVSRSASLRKIAEGFIEPNMLVKLLINLKDGKNAYGAPIVRNQDASWFNRYIIGGLNTEWDDAYGSYVFKQVFIPPNISYVAKQIRERIEDGNENPDNQLNPIMTALQFGTNVVFRDYPVKIDKQFYYNLEDQNFYKPYSELSDGEKFNRRTRLKEVKAGYDFIRMFGTKFENYRMIESASRSIKNTFKKSPEETFYLLYGLELPE